MTNSRYATVIAISSKYKITKNNKLSLTVEPYAFMPLVSTRKVVSHLSGCTSRVVFRYRL